MWPVPKRDFVDSHGVLGPFSAEMLPGAFWMACGGSFLGFGRGAGNPPQMASIYGVLGPFSAEMPPGAFWMAYGGAFLRFGRGAGNHPQMASIDDSLGPFPVCL